MRKTIKTSLLLMALSVSSASFAQLSTNPDKFLGNITTRGNVDAGGGVPNYYTLWNQITCENESKWASVEGNRGTYVLQKVLGHGFMGYTYLAEATLRPVMVAFNSKGPDISHVKIKVAVKDFFMEDRMLRMPDGATDTTVA